MRSDSAIQGQLDGMFLGHVPSPEQKLELLKIELLLDIRRALLGPVVK